MKTIIITITALFTILWACTLYYYVKINRYECYVDAPHVTVIDTFNGRVRVVTIDDRVDLRLW